ncbi:MAG: hypothetical protein MUF80_00990 [Burkholderiales bacterium]|nr:hypothetical protein [Burkholderiales bacterium]
MSGNEEAAVTGFQDNLKKVSRIQTKDGASVGFQVPYATQPVVQLLYGFKVRHEDEVVDLSGSSSPLVNAADLSGEHEPDRRRAGSWNPAGEGFLHFGFQLVEAVFSRLQFLLELAEPAGVGEVTGAQHRDSLFLGPDKQVFRHKALGSGTREVRMDVKVGDESHRADYRTSEKGSQCSDNCLDLEQERESEVESSPRHRAKKHIRGEPGRRKQYDLQLLQHCHRLVHGEH